jgi:hypothetical protein
MSTKATIAIALTAGFVGGFVGQHVVPKSVHAQGSASIPAEIRAERFVIVDEKGTPRGAFGIDEKGYPLVEATDAKGQLFFIRWGFPLFGKGRPKVIPAQ